MNVQKSYNFTFICQTNVILLNFNSSCSTEQLELKPLGLKQSDHPGYT